jgi:cupin 2 domain-containing protein
VEEGEGALPNKNEELTVRNFFADIAGRLGAEDLLAVLDSGNVRIQRIVSRAYVTPPGFWFDQDTDEWVIVLRGSATLEFENGSTVEMRAADYLTILSHVRHRVARTDDETVWLAVHLPASAVR